MNRPIAQKFESLARYTPSEAPVGSDGASAVLIPIMLGSPDRIILTLRSANLKHHAGQISFPGGRIEHGESPWDAALREAHEEIGLEPGSVRRLGQLDDVRSPRGFHIRCFVGLTGLFEPRLNHEEVARVIEVSWDELFDERLHEVKPYGARPRVHYFHFSNGLVWGVTGHIVYRLREVAKRALA